MPSAFIVRWLILSTLLVVTMRQFTAQAQSIAFKEIHLTDATEIHRIVDAHRISRGYVIPEDLRSRLGATHYGGKYHLTDEPYLIEGARALDRLGYRVAKFWFGNRLPGFHYHSDWSVLPGQTLKQVADHPYFEAAFAFPFETIFLVVHPVEAATAGVWKAPDLTFANDEQQVYELSCYLMEKYRDRDLTFVIQNWEGDWMFRGGAGVKWTRDDYAPDIHQRAQAFIQWFTVRQRAVQRARETVKNSRCRVEHAIEVNLVMKMLHEQEPGLTNMVLPHVSADYVSWSSYDGSNVVKVWQGIETIEQYAQPSPGHDKARVIIGEIGVRENRVKPEDVLKFWDDRFAVYFARNTPYILQWELYCNEPSDRERKDFRVRQAEELFGFWLLRPDGSLSHTGKLFDHMLRQAGNALTPQQLEDTLQR